MDYSSFIEKYKSFPKELYAEVGNNKDGFLQSKESEYYNLGTMQKDEDIGLSSNFVVANGNKFESSYNEYKEKDPNMSDMEAKSRVVFDFLQQNGTDFSFEKNADDILFHQDNKPINRQLFYSESVYEQACSNTNFFDRHIGDMQMICLSKIVQDQLPRNTEGMSPELLSNVEKIPTSERLEMFYKRGFYHETVHATMGTTDERKCDAFALLKVMKEHPQYSQEIFGVYNTARSKMGYTVATLNKSKGKDEIYARSIKGGAMTYLMPHTYKKLEEYAKSPEKIPSSDLDIMKLSYKLTSEPEFSKEQLKAFDKLMHQNNINSKDLENSEIVKECMAQGGFKNVETYIGRDKTLGEFICHNKIKGLKEKSENNKKKVNTQDLSKISRIQSLRMSGYVKVPYKPKDAVEIKSASLRMMSDNSLSSK